MKASLLALEREAIGREDVCHADVVTVLKGMGMTLLSGVGLLCPQRRVRGGLEDAGLSSK